MSIAGIIFWHTEFNHNYLTHFWHLVTSERAHGKQSTYVTLNTELLEILLPYYKDTLLISETVPK